MRRTRRNRLVTVVPRGRDDADEDEGDELVIWAAPAAPGIVHKRTDRTGYRLRGEPEPGRPQPPERAYRWVRRSALGIAATVMVVTGCTAEDLDLTRISGQPKPSRPNQPSA